MHTSPPTRNAAHAPQLLLQLQVLLDVTQHQPLPPLPLRLCASHRSDSNGEDLEGYAGAGLYESITMDETQLVRVDYNDDPITSDPEFRRKVRKMLPQAAAVGGVGALCREAGSTPRWLPGALRLF